MRMMDKAYVIAAIGFFVILGMGIYVSNHNYGGYSFQLGKRGDMVMNGKDLIGVAFIFGLVIIFMWIGEGRKRD